MLSKIAIASANGKSRPVPDAAAWHEHAPALADWVLKHLVNRDDRHGRYYRDRDGQTRPCTDPANAKHAKPGHLSRERLVSHFRATRADHVVGVFSYDAHKHGKWVGIDIDNHDDRADPEVNRSYALHLYQKLSRLGLNCLLYESNGRGGFHLWVVFDTPVPAAVLYSFGNWLVADHREHGFDKPPEVFPKNPGNTPWGHWLRIPGRHHKRDVWPRVWTGTEWVTGNRAVEHILALTGSDPNRIPAEAAAFGESKKTGAKDKKSKTHDDKPTDITGKGVEAWDLFNRAATLDGVAAMLERHGWTREGGRDDGAIYFVRPGKDKAQGANLKLVDGIPIFHVFTDAAGIPPGSHRPDAVRCFLEYGGDFTALNARLRDEGHGPRDVLTGIDPDTTTPDADGCTESGYLAKPAGTYHCHLARDKVTGELRVEKQVKLANFVARITGETVHDDGAEQTREFAVAVRHRNKTEATATVPVERFGSLDWIVERFGPKYVIMAGSGKRDHLRAAIQEMSGEDVPSKTVYTHTGWRQIGGRWCYLHGGGAIDGGVPVVPVVPVSHGVEVRLDGAAAGFRLPDPPTGDALRDAVRASLRLLDGLVPDPVAFPLLASVFRAALGTPDYSLWLAGPTGVQKSELAALAQQHFGASMTRNRLPGNWSSTDNALEGLTFVTKDVLIVVDDFAPPTSRADADRQHRAAERLIRAQGNHSARQRMRADGTLRPPKPPRGLILATGEDVPRGHSIAARLCVADVQRGDVDLDRLSDCQRQATAGLYAAAMAGFVAWLAPRYADVRAGLDAERADLRDRFVGLYPHARTPDVIANLMLGLGYLLRFAEAAGAIDRNQRRELWHRGQAAFRAVAEEQGEHQRAADPVARFPTMLATILSSGRGHVADVHGGEPRLAPGPEAWGWDRRVTGAEGLRIDYQPKGRKVGWVDSDGAGGELYLDPDAAFAALVELARDQNQAYPLGLHALGRRLKAAGMLARTDADRTTYPITIEGVRRRVLVLRTPSLFREPGQPGQSGQDPPDPADCVPVARPGYDGPGPKPGHATGTTSHGKLGRVPTVPVVPVPGGRDGAGGAADDDPEAEIEKLFRAAAAQDRRRWQAEARARAQRAAADAAAAPRNGSSTHRAPADDDSGGCDHATHCHANSSRHPLAPSGPQRGEHVKPSNAGRDRRPAFRTRPGAVRLSDSVEPVAIRDLKPGNILVDRAGKKLKVTDFGIGAVAATATGGEAKGSTTGRTTFWRGAYTRLYASPQQRRGDSPDPRDDVYALGVIAYQLLTGQLALGPGTDFAHDLREVGVTPG